jgi:hypothetical protein
MRGWVVDSLIVCNIDLIMLYMPQKLQMLGEMGRWLILVNMKNRGRKLWWCV